jgi:hypothetical protein
MRKGVITAVLVAAFVSAAMPAYAANPSDQTITASIGSSLTVNTSPDATVSNWALATTGANTTGGGSIVVTSNVPYTVSVTGSKATMSEYDTTLGTPAYVSGGKTLALPLNIQATKSAVTTTAVVGTSSSTLITSLGLAANETYTLTLSQTTSIADAALVSGHVYRTVVTYLAASTL